MNTYEKKQLVRIREIRRDCRRAFHLLSDILGSDTACKALAAAEDEAQNLEQAFIQRHTIKASA